MAIRTEKTTALRNRPGSKSMRKTRHNWLLKHAETGIEEASTTVGDRDSTSGYIKRSPQQHRQK